MSTRRRICDSCVGGSLWEEAAPLPASFVGSRHRLGSDHSEGSPLEERLIGRPLRVKMPQSERRLCEKSAQRESFSVSRRGGRNKGGVSKCEQTQTNADKRWQTQANAEAKTCNPLGFEMFDLFRCGQKDHKRKGHSSCTLISKWVCGSSSSVMIQCRWHWSRAGGFSACFLFILCTGYRCS